MTKKITIRAVYILRSDCTTILRVKTAENGIITKPEEIEQIRAEIADFIIGKSVDEYTKVASCWKIS